MSRLAQCPYCHTGEGYYFKIRITGSTEERYKFDGGYHEEENSDMHDALSYKQGKYAYCRSCHKRLFENKN